MLTNAWMKHDSDFFLKARNLQTFLIQIARNKGRDDARYQFLREPLLESTEITRLMPGIVLKHESLNTFWPTIQAQGGYQARENYLLEQFRPLIDYLKNSEAPITRIVVIDEQHINKEWQEALTRLQTDPEGAITSTRT
jgi:hypothetical protein